METVRDWFDQHNLALDAWRLVEDAEAGNRYTPFTDTPVVSPSAPLHARVHEAAHSAVAWNAVGPPSDAFHTRMQELETANQWLSETADRYGIDAFADPSPVLTEEEALSAAFTAQHSDWLTDQFEAYASDEYTAEDLHRQVGAAVVGEEETLRDTLSPLYDRMRKLSPVINDPTSEAVPMFSSMYETGLLDQDRSHRETCYEEIRQSDEYDAEELIPLLQAMHTDYAALQEEHPSAAAATAVMTGNTDATADLPYVLTTTEPGELYGGDA